MKRMLAAAAAASASIVTNPIRPKLAYVDRYSVEVSAVHDSVVGQPGSVAEAAAATLLFQLNDRAPRSHAPPNEVETAERRRANGCRRRVELGRTKRVNGRSNAQHT